MPAATSCPSGQVHIDGLAVHRQHVRARALQHAVDVRPGDERRRIYGFSAEPALSKTPIQTVSRACDQVRLKDGIELLDVSGA
jgi:hypothetical protein